MTTKHTPVSRFEAHWLTHTVRLQDLDATVGSKASPVFPSLSDNNNANEAQNWLIQRAYDREGESGVLSNIQRWAKHARFLFALLLILAIISGASAAMGFFGSEQKNVNVIWTLIGLIGVHFLALLAWLLGGRLTGGWLGRISFWLMSYWPKTDPLEPSAATKLARALGVVMSSKGLGKWTLSCITHAAWLTALLASLLTILLALSVRSYSFVLETTILSDAVFGEVIRGFAYLPSLVGFAIPSDDMIRGAFEGAQLAQPDAARRAWASCLSGGLLVYAIIPRALVLLFSLFRLKRAYSAMQLDVKMPGFAQLFAQTSTQYRVVDAAPAAVPPAQLQALAKGAGDSLGLVALELGKDLSWPPKGFSSAQQVLLFDEVVETGAQQKAVLQVLHSTPARRLLIVCDARVSPDRGSLHWLVDLSKFTEALAVCVLNPKGDRANDRRPVWMQSLASIGLASSRVFFTQSDGLNWLSRNE